MLPLSPYSPRSSERQRQLKQRHKNRGTKKTIDDLKKQRDIAVGMLADADLRIVLLSEKVAELQTRVDQLQPSAKFLDLMK